ncbi:MAG: FCD domain-containing protein [Bacteroides sp.]|jgi:GntR family transcriptional repressor for pyruvate dehydrogenase complex|nr:FCD domain-containing protein [Bacteroides sp.]MCI1681670.1 FCD domain-containing protein [Bacteroides sp.]
MEDEVNSQPVKFVIEHIKRQISERQIVPGERLPSERKLSESLNVSRSHVREALQKMELYGIVKTYPQSGTIVSEFSKDQLDTMITDALKISKYDFGSLVYVRVLLEVEVCKLSAANRTEEDLENIEKALIELEKGFDTDLRVEKDFAFHQAIAVGGHNPVISSLLLIITPDILKYYQKYKVCAVPQKTVHAEHREMLQKIKDKDKDGMKELVLRHLSNLIDFAKTSAKGDIPEFEYGQI